MEKNEVIFKKPESYRHVAHKLAKLGEHKLVINLFKQKFSTDRSDLTEAERIVLLESFGDWEVKAVEVINRVKNIRERSTNDEVVEYFEGYLKKVEGEYTLMCCDFAEFLTLLEPYATVDRTKVAYLAVIADTYARAARIERQGCKKRNFSDTAADFFGKAKRAAYTYLSPATFERLFFMEKYVRYQRTHEGRETECLIWAQESLDLANEEIEQLGGSVPANVQEMLDRLQDLLE